MIKAIIFDFDGVLIESVDIKTKAFANLFKNEKEEIVKRIVAYHLANTGVSRFEKFKYIYREVLHRPLSDTEFHALCDKFAEFVFQGVIRAPYVKGADRFLKNYASRYKYFIVSATPQQELGKIVKKRNIANFFQSIYGAPIRKEDAVKSIIVKEKLSPSFMLYIGDSESDYKAAKINKVNFIARINNNARIFKKINCPRIKNLMGLNRIINAL